MTPFISVIVPVYNMERLVGRCLKSIVAQSFEDIEVLVIDDGSTDGSCEVIGEYAAKDQRVKNFRISNAGVSSARNMGLDKASGEYVLFIDADDEIEEDYLRNIADKAKSTCADILVWGIKRCFEDGHIEEWKPYLDGSYDRKAFLTAFPREQYWYHIGLYGFVSNKLLKKSIIDRDNLRFDKSLRLMEDYDFFLRSYALCETFYCFHEMGYRYNIYGSNRGSIRYSDSAYCQLVNVQTKCVDLLKSEDAFTEENEHLLSKAICNLSTATFIEMRDVNFRKVKSCMDSLWENPECIAAVKKGYSQKKHLRHLILKRNVPMTCLYVRFWRIYMFFRKGGEA